MLVDAGKVSWVVKRDEVVHAKGKGEIVTYWVNPGSSSSGLGTSSMASDEGEPKADKRNLPKARKTFPQADLQEEEAKRERLIQWNVELLQNLLGTILANRGKGNNDTNFDLSNTVKYGKSMSNPMLELEESISLPKFDPSKAENDTAAKQLSPKLLSQLRGYVKAISAMYSGNAFHNFEHASHACMSVNKLLHRIVSPNSHTTIQSDKETVALNLHFDTFGISSDPLTQFALVFATLVHDVDHAGVSNLQLIKEQADIATIYNNRSVAEQNSIDLAWELLMEPTYEELHASLFASEEDFRRFRSLVVNLVIATDIFDPDLKASRNQRWEKAFSMKESTDLDLKATIVLEHIIQASDVAHTMQHWHVYQKWNEKLFLEMYTAFKAGRGDKDPSGGWFLGELWFYDNYVIPLGKKLKECGVFGVSSDEYLNYALENRKEWELKGRGLVQSWVERYSERFEHQ